MRNVAIGGCRRDSGNGGGGCPGSVTPSDADVMRELRDRVQIEDLMWRYTRALDTNDGGRLCVRPTLRTDSSPPAPTRRKGAMRCGRWSPTYASGTPMRQAKGEPKRPPMYHMTANHRLTFSDKDHARVEAYTSRRWRPAGPNAPLRVAAVGRSVDDLVRVNGQWLIRTRNVAGQDLTAAAGYVESRSVGECRPGPLRPEAVGAPRPEGQRHRERRALALPALLTLSRRPPCSSTRWRTMAMPRPRPPC